MPNEATHPGASDILHFLEGFQAQAKVQRPLSNHYLQTQKEEAFIPIDTSIGLGN